jgi:RNA polymerase-binding transcription factor DksA
MPSRAKDPDPQPDRPKRQKKRRFPRGGPTAAEKRRLRTKLLAMRQQLVRSSQDLADEALKGSGQDFSVDHMADYGSDNFEQDFSLALLEGETEVLQAIDAALLKLDGRSELPYGVCEDCAQDEAWDPETPAPWIPTGRLEVLPYAPLCVAHQEAQEEV